MAGTISKEVKSTAPAPAASSGQATSRYVLLIGAAVATVVAVQIGGTYLLLRSGGGDSHDSRGHDDVPATPAGRSHSDHDTVQSDFAEVSLGEFSFSNTVAVSGVVMHVDFRLTAVAASNSASTLESQIRVRQERVREAVNRVVRNSNIDELYDPNLGTLKRLLREEINRLLGKNLITEVVINDIRVLEQ